MVRRFRFTTALLALLTLTAYSAEGVAAVLFCAPAAEQSAPAHAGHGSGDSSSESGPEHQSHCPLGMVGAGSCVAASLPAPSAPVAAVSQECVYAFPAPPAGHDLTSGHPLFRPPRA